MESRLIPAIILTTIGLLFAACRQTSGRNISNDPWGTITVRSNEPVRIAVISAASNSAAGGEGIEHLQGVELAVERRGRIEGFPIEIVAIESDCTSESGETAAQTIVDQGNIVAVVGPTCAVECQATAPIFEEAHLVAVSPSCSSTNLTDEILHVDSFMRTMYDDVLEGHASAEFAYAQLGARRAAIVDDGTIETAGLVAAFEARFAQLGGEVVLSRQIPPITASVIPILEEIADARPDVVYAPLLPAHSTRFVMQADMSSLAGTPILGGRHILSQWFISHVGTVAEGLYALGPYTKAEAYLSAEEAFLSRYSVEPRSTAFAFAYDATTLILLAIEKVASVQSQEMHIGRQALREALYQTSDYPGLTGNLTCTRWGDCSAGNLMAGQVRSGEWVALYLP